MNVDGKGRFVKDPTAREFSGVGLLGAYVVDNFSKCHRVAASGCWEWTKSVNNRGYGQQRHVSHEATLMSELGAIFYRGPSLLNGEPIVGIVTGLEGGSMNPKTGPMAQAWILRADRSPREAIEDSSDDAICGNCALRGDGAFGRTCYVAWWFGPANVYKQFRKGAYLEVSWPEMQALLEGRHVRLGAYGDPAAIPVEVWGALLTTVAGWVAYTHAWRTCDQRFRAIAMASVDTEAEFWAAREAGWRTFRVRGRDDSLIASGFGSALEVRCPASDEANHRTTCQKCQLCRGLDRPARSIAIVAHGKPGNVAAFYRNRQEAVA